MIRPAGKYGQAAPFLLPEQSRETLHKADTCRYAEQHGAVHLFARRQLCKAFRDNVPGRHYPDLGISRSLVFVWHARQFVRYRFPIR
jgi:hypothetical protein